MNKVPQGHFCFDKSKQVTRGFSLIEIIISLAILAIMFSFMFYFISTIMLKNKLTNNKPFMLTDYNYSNKYCYLNENQQSNLSIAQTLNMGAYISTTTPITSISIFNKNKLIVTTNSASTTEKDIFLFDFGIISNQISLTLLQSLDIGPGINDALLHDNFIYVLNTSVNSHVKTLKINSNNTSMSQVGDIKIDSLRSSGALPKKVYLYNKNLLIGTEKNNSGGELFVLPIDQNNIPKLPTKSIELGGQVSDIYENQRNIFVANASDTELFVYDTDFNSTFAYDAPLSLGNGKSVYYQEPYIYLGRTVASFELFFLEIKNLTLNYINKYKAYGSIDFIQNVDQNILILSSAGNKEFQMYDKQLHILKTVDLPDRVSSYTCFENSFLFSILINNQANILWLK